jgi:hypothetical protein
MRDFWSFLGKTLQKSDDRQMRKERREVRPELSKSPRQSRERRAG